MYDNPGRRLKRVGGIVLFAGMILSIIGSSWMFYLADQASKSYYAKDSFGGFVLAGILIMLLGVFFSYLMSIFTIAFGELVENSTVIRHSIENKKTYPTSSVPIHADETVHFNLDDEPS